MKSASRESRHMNFRRIGCTVDCDRCKTDVFSNERKVLSMQQQQQQLDFSEKLKRDFNICHFLFLIHQRAIVVVCRDKWGTQALGLPCLLAFIMMMLWYVFTHDNLMLLWIGFWLLCLAKRRIQSVRLARRGVVLHSRYDGWPFDAMKFVKSENAAKLVVEPILTAILGFMAFKYYQYMGWPPSGLPYSVLSAIISQSVPIE